MRQNESLLAMGQNENFPLVGQEESSATETERKFNIFFFSFICLFSFSQFYVHEKTTRKALRGIAHIDNYILIKYMLVVTGRYCTDT
jgi:hypothetical protein